MLNGRTASTTRIFWAVVGWLTRPRSRSVPPLTLASPALHVLCLLAPARSGPDLCARLCETQHKGAIAFRDIVLLRTRARAVRLQAAIHALASQEDLDLPDHYFDVMTSFTSLLEELDVMDDLTGGGKMRGQSILRKRSRNDPCF